jgi:hypothetical protein
VGLTTHLYPDVKERVELLLYSLLWAFFACSRAELFKFLSPYSWYKIMNGQVPDIHKRCFVGDFGVQLFGEIDDGCGTLK